MARDGSIFVSDGYCNSRVVKFDPNGSFKREYTMPPGMPAMAVPHSVVIQECLGWLYVADREGAKVHAFDMETGKLEGGGGAGDRVPPGGEG